MQLSPSDVTHEFSLIEIYGGSHLVFETNTTTVTTARIVGDDTSYISMREGQTLDINEVCVQLSG